MEIAWLQLTYTVFQKLPLLTSLSKKLSWQLQPYIHSSPKWVKRGQWQLLFSCSQNVTNSINKWFKNVQYPLYNHPSKQFQWRNCHIYLLFSSGDCHCSLIKISLTEGVNQNTQCWERLRYSSHWIFITATGFKTRDAHVESVVNKLHSNSVSSKYFSCPYQLSFHQSFRFTCHLSPNPI